MRFLNRSEVRPWFEGRRVAIVGSGPGCDENSEGWVDSHEVVVRVNNFKTTARTGRRCDIFYSFFGVSIKKTAEELKRHGVRLCMAKCPNAHAIESDWHRRHNKMIGVDFRPHYQRRANWWFCDTYIPTVEEFMVGFNILDRHMPTSGFAAILDVLSFSPESVFLTGFDFFQSGVHNVDEPWREKNLDDPFRHLPSEELNWVARNAKNHSMRFDQRLERLVNDRSAALHS